MWLYKATGALNRVVALISRYINSVAAGILIAMMFLTAADVLLRYLFNRPISGSFEITEYMMAIIVSFGLAHCAIQKGHVRVDLVLSRFTPKGQAVISSFMYLLSFVFFVLVTWQSLLYIGKIFKSHLTSAVLLIPNFPFVALLAIGIAVFSLVLLVDFLDYLSQVVKG
jgi:TRAP-type C4-dicarboxylate transport system permease small subunit